MPKNKTMAVAMTAISSSFGTKLKKALIGHPIQRAIQRVVSLLLAVRRATIQELNKFRQFLLWVREDF